MSHEDAVVKLPKDFKTIAYTKDSKLTIIENTKKIIWRSISSRSYAYLNGKQIFKNFYF